MAFTDVAALAGRVLLSGLFLHEAWFKVANYAIASRYTQSFGFPSELLPAAIALEAIAGLLVLVGGTRLLVQGASEIARGLGVSEAVIGLTIVAIGTSLPELATSVIAALRGKTEIALGNVIGSNVFNIFGIIGTTALVTPIPAAPRFAATDMPWVAGAAAALVLASLWPGRLPRVSGVLLLAAYAVYVVRLA